MKKPSISKRIARASFPFMASVASVAALAQDALPGSDLILPADAPLNADMIILKTDEVGGINKFKIVVTNTGPVAVTGAVVADKVGNGGICPAANPVTISGDGVPAGTFKVSDLGGAGIVLATLNSGQSATLSYSCQGK